MNRPLETPSTVRARAAALAEAAREYYDARTGGERHRAFQRMQAMSNSKSDPIVCALLDQLTDIRCAIRDGLLAYAYECIERAEILTRGLDTAPEDGAPRERFVAKVLK